MRLFSIFILFTFHSALFCQINRGFIDHLEKNKLQREHFQYLQKFKSGDSLAQEYHFQLTRYYLTYSNDSLLISNAGASGKLIQEDTCIRLSISNHFLSSPSIYTQKWFNDSIKFKATYDLQQQYKIFDAGNHPLKYNANEFDPALQASFKKIQKHAKKKAFIAGTLSTIIPGLGKLYIGQPNSFLTTFFSQTIMGLQLYESISKRGFKSGLTIFNIGFTGLFYFGNIYGSITGVKKRKKELQKQFYINASRYYTYSDYCIH